MISIIVSSYKEDFFSKLEASIDTTIGLKYEIIKITNHGLMGICEAYNVGISRAKYEVIVFCHEDIIFRTMNWGAELIKIINSDLKIGLVGLAGNRIKTSVPSGWHCSNDKYLAYNFIQSDYKNKTETIYYCNVDKITEVAVVDGFFMVSKKNVLKKYHFDSELLKGFHGYDLDISLAIGQEFKIVISHNIKVEHFSVGNPDKYWFNDMIKVHSKYSQLLPVNTNSLDIRYIEFINLKAIISYVHKNEISYPIHKLIYKHFKNLGLYNYIISNLYYFYVFFLRRSRH